MLFPIRGDDGGRGARIGQLPHRVVVRFLRQPRIEPCQLRAQRTRQDHFTVRAAAQQAVRPEVFAVVGMDRCPAEFPFQVLGRRPLNQRVFGEV